MESRVYILLLRIIGIIFILFGLIFIPAVLPAVILLPTGVWMVVYGGRVRRSDRSWMKQAGKPD